MVLDLEVGEGLGQDAVSAWAETWAWHLRALAPGYVPGVYMGSAYLTNRTGQGLRGPFGWLWYPRYPAKYANQSIWPPFDPWPPKNPNTGEVVAWEDSAWGGLPDLWQFSKTFPSGQGALDASVFNGSIEDLAALNGRA